MNVDGEGQRVGALTLDGRREAREGKKENMSYQKVRQEVETSYYPPPGYGSTTYTPPSAPPPPPPPPYEGYPPPPPPPPVGYPYPPPPAGGYQGYFSQGYPPPPQPQPQPHYQVYHVQQYQYEDHTSFLRGCLAALCCCCVLEECCI